MEMVGYGCMEINTLQQAAMASPCSCRSSSVCSESAEGLDSARLSHIVQQGDQPWAEFRAANKLGGLVPRMAMSWTMRQLCQPVAVEGLICCHLPNNRLSSGNLPLSISRLRWRHTYRVNHLPPASASGSTVAKIRPRRVGRCGNLVLMGDIQSRSSEGHLPSHRQRHR